MTTSLTVAPDPTGPTSAINSFVTAYNSLVGIVNTLTRYDAATNAWITMTIPRPPADLATTMTAPRVISIAVHTPHDVWIAVAYEDVAADGQDTSGDMPDGGPPSHGAMLHITDPAQLK